MNHSPRQYTIEFYEDPTTGGQPVLEWMRNDITPFQRRSIGIAMSEILERQGIGVCGTEYGKTLGHGLFEFRLRHGADEIAAMFTTKKPDARDREPILLRVYCHAHGDKLIVILAGYDKANSPSKKRRERRDHAGQEAPDRVPPAAAPAQEGQALTVCVISHRLFLQ